MKTLEELEKYIDSQAEEHAKDDSLYELIEIDTYREIVRFYLKKGFYLDEIDFDVFLDGINYDDADNNLENDSRDGWYYFSKLLDIIEEMDSNNKLPAYVKHLHDYWKKSFFENS